MFTLYMKWDAQEQLKPEDVQFIYRPTEAMELASIFYELDYTQYHQQSYPRMRIPERKDRVHNRYFSEPYKRRRADYSDELYDDVESYLRMGWMIGVDTREEWNHFSHPFSFDQDSNLVFDCFMDHGTTLFEQNVRRIYEESLNKHQGRKPPPTVRFRPSGEPVQHAQAAKTLNSKGVGRLLAAGGVYNGNVEGYRQTAEQLGGEAPAGFDQVLNETTKGVAIAGVSVAAGLGIGRAGAASEVGQLEKLAQTHSVIEAEKIGAFSIDDLSRNASIIDKGDLTRAGRALQKHGNRVGSAFPSVTGNSGAINQQGQSIVDGILNDTNKSILYDETPRFGQVIDVFSSSGQGLRYDATEGKLIGFLEPPRAKP